ncbi:hypothetical protein LCGC14_1108990 [marine sediment metagenome]|uniref:Uncharacterized protein n=1 Tax=marine sediment metagenome TaxID=412755 RepID=A0A0F9PQH3_9ZZZZ
MSGPHHNITTQKASVTGEDVFEIWSLDDLPAPVSGVITITKSGLYIFEKTIVFGTNRIELADGVTFLAVISNSFENVLTYAGSDTFLTGLGNNTVRFLSWGGVTVLMFGNDATFMNIKGSMGFDFSAVVFIGTGGTIGTVTGVDTGATTTSRFFIKASSIINYKNGLILDSAAEIRIGPAAFKSTTDSTDATIKTIGSKGAIFTLDKTTITLNSASACAFDIDPTMTTNTQINSTFIGDLGDYFKVGTTGSITTISDNVGSSATVDSVSVGTDSIGTKFTLLFTRDYKEGQIVIHTGFTDSNYNGTFTITKITSTTEYEISSITFTATDTGNSRLKEILATTSGVHGLSVGDTLSIIDTVDYNAGYHVISTPQTTNFVVSAIFINTETGTFDTGSLTEASKYIDVQSSGSQKDSKSEAFGRVNGNSTATTITDGTYAAINVTGFTDNAVTSRFVLTNASAGIYRYDGLNPISGRFVPNISATKTGSTANYRFALSIDGAIPVFATAEYQPMEVKTTKVTIPVIFPFTLTPGQTIQLMVAGDGTGDTLTITDLSNSI